MNISENKRTGFMIGLTVNQRLLLKLKKNKNRGQS